MYDKTVENLGEKKGEKEEKQEERLEDQDHFGKDQFEK
jgi:hypothetical protein